MHKRLTLIPVLVLTSFMLGCAGTKDAVLPQDGPSIRTIYMRHLHDAAPPGQAAACPDIAARPVEHGDSALHGYTRTAHNEIEAVFPRLANPYLVMYVFPHLAGAQRVPVPGYATSFPMYERTEYALPGEGPLAGQR